MKIWGTRRGSAAQPTRVKLSYYKKTGSSHETKFGEKKSLFRLLPQLPTARIGIAADETTGFLLRFQLISVLERSQDLHKHKASQSGLIPGAFWKQLLQFFNSVLLKFCLKFKNKTISQTEFSHPGAKAIA